MCDDRLFHNEVVLYLITPMKHRRERPMCRSAGTITHLPRIIVGGRLAGGFGTAHRPFPTVINEGGSIINNIFLLLMEAG